MLNKTNLKSLDAQRGNATIIAIVAVLVVALGAGAFFLTSGKDDSAAPEVVQAKTQAETQAATQEAASEPAAGDEAAPAEPAKKAEAKPVEMTPGNPVVAKLGGQEIKRDEVLGLIDNLSPQIKQMPKEKLFPIALEQIVNTKIVEGKVASAKVADDPKVKAEIEAAKKQIINATFMEQEAEKAMTDEVLKAAYDQYKKNFSKMDEVKASVILVKDQTTADEVLKKLEDGGKFADLAKEYSIDPSKADGGQYKKYVVKEELMPELADAVFALKKGEYTKTAIKSQFGYQIVKQDDIRARQPLSFEEAKPYLENQLRGQVLNALVQKWRSEADLEVFDINGNALEPASGEEKKAEEKK